MKKQSATLLLVCLTSMLLHAQKRVCSYPFEFEKSFLQLGSYEAHFLDNQSQSTFAIILKDNKKAEYALMDKKFKVISKINSAISSTVFNENIFVYAGGTSSGNKFNFVYSGRSDFQMETVDFDSKTISHKKIFELPKAEKAITSFNANNTYYAVAANDKTNELVFYILDENGNLTTRTVPVKIPDGVSRQHNKLSTYLDKLHVVKHDEEPDFSQAIVSAKLFTHPDHFELVVNDEGQPTHLLNIQLPSFNAQEKFIAYDGVLPAGDKGNVYISSYEKNGKLFSLLLNKKNIRLAVHDLQSGSLQNKLEINDDANFSLFAQAPVTERRYGKKDDAKDVTELKKLIKALTKGTEGVMVYENKTGQLVVTIGTYDLIPVSSGGSGGWQGGFEKTTIGNTSNGPITAMTWNPNMYYRPGAPSYTTTSARYYTTTYFKLLLDPATLKPARGRVPQPVAEQVKDYIEGVDSKAKATNQFAMGKDQFYGYYDRDTKAYVIDQIRIIQ